MADVIMNFLMEHFPNMVRVLSALTPLQALLLTAAILAAGVVGSGYINGYINKTAKGRGIPIRKAASSREIPKELRELLRDEEEFDVDWMDAYLVSIADRDEKRAGR